MERNIIIYDYKRDKICNDFVPLSLSLGKGIDMSNTRYIKINHEKFGYDVLAMFQSFYTDSRWQLVFPGCRESIIEEAQEAGIFCELEFMTDDDIDSDGKAEAVSDKKSDYDADFPVRVRIENEELYYEGGKGKAFKEGFGGWLYDELKRITGYGLPWGTLNGVRPTKLAYQRLEQGMSHDEIMDYYLTERKTSTEKAELAIEIASREREILSRLHIKEGYSLYIGIPFCPTTCLYCSFTSYPIAQFRKQVDSYLDALIKELEYVADSMNGRSLDTIYIGGGTPTTLEAEQLDRLISGVEELFDMSGLAEFTVEAGRADSITAEKLKVLKAHNVTRISINPQTFNQETLDFIGRKATVQQLLDIWPVAREIGFDNINMDIILGLPDEDEKKVEYTMKMINELKPDSLTVHSLAIKRASKLSQWIIQNGKSTLNNTDSTMEIAFAGAKELGLEPYYLYRQKNMSGNFENVGFAEPGKYGIYNILIMEEVQTIVACGAGTVTKRVFYDGDKIDKLERCENVKDVALYIEKIDEMIERKKVLFSDEK